jgi:hypothetical protein
MVQNNNLQSQPTLVAREKLSQQIDNKHCFREPRDLFNVVLTLLKNFFFSDLVCQTSLLSIHLITLEKTPQQATEINCINM